MNIVKIKFSLFFILFLTSCAATYTSVAKKDIVVQNKMNKSVFLEPVSQAKRIVFIEVRNTSDSPDFNIESEVKTAIASKGYKITDNPSEANFLLQANVLHTSYSGESSGSAFGSAITGAVIGGAGGAAVSGGSKGAVGGAILGGLISSIADAAVKDVTYNIITDLLISERDYKDKENEWKQHKARIISTANQANLKFDEAVPALKKGIAMGVSGVF